MFYPYLAGLIDGDGCLYEYKRKNTSNKERGIFIANTYKPVLRYCQNCFGGHVRQCTPTKNVKYNQKPIYRWIVTHQLALQVIPQIMPYLQEKYDKAQLIWPECNQIEQKEITKKEWTKYIAGFFDAEGCIHITKKIRDKKEYYCLAVTLVNTYKPIIEKIAVYYEKPIYIKKDKRNKKYKTLYLVNFINRQAKRVLKDILPYLIIKKKKAEIAMEFPSRKHASQEEQRQFRNLINEKARR